MRPVLGWLLLALFAVSCAEILDISMFYVTKLVVDYFSTGSPEALNFQHALFLLLILAGMGGFTSLFWRLSGFAASHALPATYQRMVQSLFAYVAGHNPGYFYDHFAGALATKIRNVADGYFDLQEGMLFSTIGILVSIGGAFIMFTAIHPYLLLVILCWMVAFAISYRVLGPGKRHYSKEVSLRGSRKTGHLVDAMSNMLTVSLFARREKEVRNFRHVLYDEFDAKRASWRYSDLMALTNTLITLTARLVLMTIVAYLWFEKQATTGDIVLVFGIAGTLSTQLRQMAQLLNRLYSALGSIDEGLETLLVPHGILDVPHALPLVITRGEVRFDHVSFAYAGRASVLKDFTLVIQPGEKVGLVGRSGAGKTTLMSLLLRFYDVTKGAILIDGQNIRDITQESLRDQVSMVPQEPLLFHRTILENIRYGKPEATKEEVESAAKKALAHDFILALPEGYDTKVGERGVKLSGGQRQRIAIARAILKNAPILVLDEATASLDSESEVAISEALHNLVEQKTVIAIAHRLSTLREMTRILVMDGGQIIEDGTHDALLAQGGLYASLWETQAGGFLQEE